MGDQLGDSPVPVKRLPLLVAVVLSIAIMACSIYANLSFAVTRPANYRFFPPFKPNVNANDNRHLGGEYWNIAKSLVAGEGFANPFPGKTGPTAWMPPLLPALLAGLLWACDGNRDAVMTVVIVLQVLVLLGTGLLVLALVRQTTSRVAAGVAALIFFLAVLCDFRHCFQFTHDCWFVLLFLDLLIAGFCWWRPLRSGKSAAGWGVFGGICALVSPVAGFTWGTCSFLLSWRQRIWSRLVLAGLFAGLTLLPWTVRNYLVLGRLVPVKSNAAYELYQSQCLQPDGMLQGSTFRHHPYASGGRERQEYRAVGEIAFVDHKREQFWESVRADPADFLDRVACRFLGVTLWYSPLDRVSEARQRPWVFWMGRLTHPLPFLGLLVLIFSALWRPLPWTHWAVMGVYCFYLLPYICVSYYERYGFPLLGAKVLLVIWAVDQLLSLRRKKPTARATEAARVRRPAAPRKPRPQAV